MYGAINLPPLKYNLKKKGVDRVQESKKKEIHDENFDELENKDYVYFVSYYHSRGFGNTEVVMDGEIISMEQIASIQEYIAKEFGLKDVKVKNWLPLRVQDSEAEGYEVQELIDIKDNQNKDYVYFVSYYHSRGFGNTEVVMGSQILSIDQIISIEKLVEENYKLKNVKVKNWILFGVKNVESDIDDGSG